MEITVSKSREIPTKFREITASGLAKLREIPTKFMEITASGLVKSREIYQIQRNTGIRWLIASKYQLNSWKFWPGWQRARK